MGQTDTEVRDAAADTDDDEVLIILDEHGCVETANALTHYIDEADVSEAQKNCADSILNRLKDTFTLGSGGVGLDISPGYGAQTLLNALAYYPVDEDEPFTAVYIRDLTFVLLDRTDAELEQVPISDSLTDTDELNDLPPEPDPDGDAIPGITVIDAPDRLLDKADDWESAPFMESEPTE